jgi:enoyl-CoA hydratase/carnithine racemase
MTDAVTTETEGTTATLWLERPERGNALGPDLVEGLEAAIDAALAAGARLLVLRGRGRNFCTGFDLSDLESASDGDLALRILRIELLLQRVHGLPVATLAIAQGRAFGAGADLFAACDHRIALPGSSFAFPGPAFGLVLGTARLAGLVGGPAARRILLAGETVTAEAAVTLGLASASVEDSGLEAAIAAAGIAAARLDGATVAALHGRTRAADDAGDLAALARSVAVPGLKRRILEYRARSLAARPGKG